MDDELTDDELVKFCPGCGGSSLQHVGMAKSENPLNPVYDVICEDCKWTGDISPDLRID